MHDDGTVLVPLAPGFEEVEAVAIVDVLRRADVDVTVVGLAPGPVLGAHGIEIATDATIDDVAAERVRMLVLPGGMPGTTNLMADERVLTLVRALHADGRTTAAICAAPLVLDAAGVAAGVPLTAHPSVHERLPGADLRPDERVCRTGSIVTSQGPGTALEFALALVEELRGAEAARALAAGMRVAVPR